MSQKAVRKIVPEKAVKKTVSKKAMKKSTRQAHADAVASVVKALS